MLRIRAGHFTMASAENESDTGELLRLITNRIPDEQNTHFEAGRNSLNFCWQTDYCAEREYSE